jgi:hypothetical protein
MSVKGSRYEKNGWICIDIHGSPYERGYAIGYLLEKEIKTAIKTLDFILMNTYGLPRIFFSDVISELFRKQIITRFIELYREMEGIVDGIKSKKIETKNIKINTQENVSGNENDDMLSIDDIIMWNCYLMIDSMFSSISDLILTNKKLKRKYAILYDNKAFINKPRMIERCTAFIAVGDHTKNGKIVCAHNSFSNFIDTQCSNIIMYVYPDKGNAFVMQTSPGWIWSGTDFYISSNGFICTETTIGGFYNFKLRDPVFCRIRKAVQYANTLDEYSKILIERNGGDYANSWLIGDINNNTIMRIELGYKFVNIEKKTNGYFIGYNSAEDPRIRNMETDDTDLYNIKTSSGARRVRLTEFMEKYKGKIDVKIGKIILADHYDVYLKKINPSNRTCCSHYDLDETRFIDYVPFYPGGALDGIVTDSDLARDMKLYGRWGNSCGIPFDASKFIEKHPQWNDFKPYLIDRPSQPWTVFSKNKSERILTSKNKHKHKHKHKNKHITKTIKVYTQKEKEV